MDERILQYSRWRSQGRIKELSFEVIDFLWGDSFVFGLIANKHVVSEIISRTGKRGHSGGCSFRGGREVVELVVIVVAEVGMLGKERWS